jgi:predicted N-formylglutamate amidohydrolase
VYVDLVLYKALLLSHKEKSRTTGEFCQMYKEELTTIIHKCFKKLKRKEYFTIHSCMPLYQNQIKTSHENYRPTSLINRDAKLPNKILAYRIQQLIKRIEYHD